MDIVSMSLEEDTLSWYNYETEYRLFAFADWNEAKRRMLARFVIVWENSRGEVFRYTITGDNFWICFESFKSW